MTAPPGPGYPVTIPPTERIRLAYQSRAQSDYIFSFWTALGWFILTFGIYGYYVLYQLIRRSRDHNRRRLELLDATTTYAWDRAVAQGKAEELRPRFEQVAVSLEPMRRMTADFRDPVIWLVLAFVASGIVHFVAYVLLDQDLVKHEWGERAAQAQLAEILTIVGVIVHPTGPPTKRNHNYVGRVIATICSLGFYGFWWTSDVMSDGNKHFYEDWRWEDELAAAVQAAA
ncbi:MAG: hypothetical protein QOG53_773 [Frankiales bacterium]|jgi:hypothetical protein|nr:hypothetical protein [Frankiales bacterium]